MAFCSCYLLWEPGAAQTSSALLSLFWEPNVGCNLLHGHVLSDGEAVRAVPCFSREWCLLKSPLCWSCPGPLPTCAVHGHGFQVLCSFHPLHRPLYGIIYVKHIYVSLSIYIKIYREPICIWADNGWVLHVLLFTFHAAEQLGNPCKERLVALVFTERRLEAKLWYFLCLCKHIDTSDFHEHKGTEKEPHNCLFFFPCKFLVSP